MYELEQVTIYYCGHELWYYNTVSTANHLAMSTTPIEPYQGAYGLLRNQACSLGLNCSCSGGSVTVKVSSISLSNASPVSPGANVMSKFCTMVDNATRRLSCARFLPGQL